VTADDRGPAPGLVQVAGVGLIDEDSRPTEDLNAYRSQVRAWLASRQPLPRSRGQRSFGERLARLRELQAILWAEGWARRGWPEEVGGVGGDARHRALLYDELALAGYPFGGVYEHVEILAPALLRHWSTEQMGRFLPRLLCGDDVWCQGFSEPDSGSDLSSMRTRATRDGEGYRLNGRKIWTSWAAYADRCVVLARTGPADERHRSLSAFFIDLDVPGVEVRALRQANGLDELAEVTFDDVLIPRDRLIGEEGTGWSVALDILSCERSAFAWLRQTKLYLAAERIAAAAGPSALDAVGDAVLDLFAVRTASARAVAQLGQGLFLGPEAAPVKLLLSTAEQAVYDAAQRVFGPDMVLGAMEDSADWQEEYLFSRIVTIYGGSRQMQLSTVARFLLGIASR
jgi:alkylation response protein AidB-like acyl-CoA dehydrogenase